MSHDEFRSFPLFDYAVALRGYRERINHKRLLLAWQTSLLMSMWSEKSVDMADLVPDLFSATPKETPEEEKARIESKFGKLFPELLNKQTDG